MASQASIEAVEVYTTNEPCMVKTIEYKGLVETKIFEDFGGALCKEFIKFWNLYQSSTTLGLDPVSSHTPKANWLQYSM